LIDYQIKCNKSEDFLCDQVLDYVEICDGKFLVRCSGAIVCDKIVPLSIEDFGMRFEGESFLC